MKNCLEVDSFKSKESEFLQHTVDSSNFFNAQENENSPLHCLRSVWKNNLSSKNEVIFFCRLVSQTIEAYFAKEYTLFDAHTTTNCCHGIALLARQLVLEITQLDLHILKEVANKKLIELETFSKDSNFCTDWVPKSLIKLSSLYLLATTRTLSEGRQKTDARSLKKISSIGSSFCWTITNNLKKNVSNLVAHKYRSYLNLICPHTDINGAPIHLWGNYIQPDYIRTDKTNTDYVACIFSMQVSLAYLIKTKAKIALVNDIIGSNGELKGRYVRLLEGDGKNNFKVMTENINLLSLDQSEPIIVFSGYVSSDTLTIQELSLQMHPWLNEFPRLMLACDIFYPQFPAVRDDFDFNSSPIHPKEDVLKEIFLSYSKIQGVSATDPSLYCASHIYLASLEQITKTVKNKEPLALPACFYEIHPPSLEKKKKTNL